MWFKRPTVPCTLAPQVSHCSSVWWSDRCWVNRSPSTCRLHRQHCTPSPASASPLPASALTAPASVSPPLAASVSPPLAASVPPPLAASVSPPLAASVPPLAASVPPLPASVSPLPTSVLPASSVLTPPASLDPAAPDDRSAGWGGVTKRGPCYATCN